MAMNGMNGSSSAPNVPEVRTNGHPMVGHDCWLQSVINDFMRSQLALKGYEWYPQNGVSNASNHSNDSLYNQTINSTQRTKIVEALRALGQQYVHLYEQQLSAMCERLEVHPMTALATFESVSNELFIEGIKWNHIITFLVFGSEFALNCVRKGYPNLVNEVSNWMTSYATQHLNQWVNDNGSWEYVIEFATDKVQRPEGDGQTKLLYGAAGALGVLTLGLFLRNFSFFK